MVTVKLRVESYSWHPMNLSVYKYLKKSIRKRTYLKVSPLASLSSQKPLCATCQTEHCHILAKEEHRPARVTPCNHVGTTLEQPHVLEYRHGFTPLLPQRTSSKSDSHKSPIT